MMEDSPKDYHDYFLPNVNDNDLGASVNVVNKDMRFQSLFPEVTDTKIYVDPGSIRNGFLHNEKEMLLDFFATKYQGQQIIIRAGDGENLKECGLYDFLERLIEYNLLLRENVLITSHNAHFAENFRHELESPACFWKWTPEGDFSTVPTDAKFAGATIGRFTPTRFRAVYELYQAFGNDTFIIFNPQFFLCERFMLRMGQETYAKELNWLKNHQFDKDEEIVYNHWHNNVALGPTTIGAYSHIWSKYHIEIVPETDVLSNYWFTEKTSRCLITGKPFVLLAGQHSLKRIREMGFTTFDKVIDESYDEEIVPARKVSKMIESLRELYNSPDREQRIQQLYDIAKLNQKIFPKLKKFYYSRIK